MNMSGHTQGPIDRLRPYSIAFERIRLFVTLKIPAAIIMIISQAGVPLQSVSIQLSAADTNIFEIRRFRVRSHVQRGDFSMLNRLKRGPKWRPRLKSALYMNTHPHINLLTLKMWHKDVKAHIFTGNRDVVGELEHQIVLLIYKITLCGLISGVEK